MKFSFRNPLSAAIMVALACLTMASSGCSLFSNKMVASADTSVERGQIPVATYEVRIYGKGKPQQHFGKLDSNKTVQSILVETGVREKFNRMKIMLVRDIPGSEGKQKLDVDFDEKSRNVIVSQDYSIHPKDIIVIRRDDGTKFDEMVDKFTGAIGLGG